MQTSSSGGKHDRRAVPGSGRRCTSHLFLHIFPANVEKLQLSALTAIASRSGEAQGIKPDPEFPGTRDSTDFQAGRINCTGASPRGHELCEQIPLGNAFCAQSQPGERLVALAGASPSQSQQLCHENQTVCGSDTQVWTYPDF